MSRNSRPHFCLAGPGGSTTTFQPIAYRFGTGRIEAMIVISAINPSSFVLEASAASQQKPPHKPEHWGT